MVLRRHAEQLAAPYPHLLAQAQRVAAIVTQGVHGRRRAGQGETFWEYRNYHSSDAASRIDWRRSARGAQLYVRENEWEAANTVYFWRDGNAGMDWTSAPSGRAALPTKQDRASMLSMALAILLMRAGERCAVMGETNIPRTGRLGLERIALRLAASEGPIETLGADIPAHARLVIASDFLEGSDVWAARLAKLSARPAKGILLQIIDPAERDFPYRGRLKLRLPGGRKTIGETLAPLLVGRAEQAREDYRQKFKAHCGNLSEVARRLDWPLITHETDAPPSVALTSAYMALSGEAL
jgi:uncharacterized protein (DUF58 family)